MANIVNYSLVIGIKLDELKGSKEVEFRESIKLGIINIFQTYNSKRLLHSHIKPILSKIPEVDYTGYKQRMMKFVQLHVFKICAC
jgi:hypothetical protein